MLHAGLPRSGNNIWKMKFFSRSGKNREFCGWPGKFRKNLESQGKVREFENKWLWQAIFRKFIDSVQEGKGCTFSWDSLSPSPSALGATLSIHVISPDFGGSSWFGAFSPGLTLRRRNLLTRGFSNVVFSLTVFLFELFIIYRNNLPGGLLLNLESVWPLTRVK